MFSIVTNIGVFCVFYVIRLEKITKDNNEVEWQKGADDCPMVQGNHPRGTSVCGKIPDGG